jgi:hypothetical protein
VRTVHRSGALLAVMGLFLAACGSTVPAAQRTSLRGGAGGLGGDAAAGADGDLSSSAGASAETGGASTAAASATRTARSAAAAAARPVTQLGDAIVPSNHPGVTKTEVRIGVTYASDGSQVSDAFGLKGVNGLSGDEANKLFHGLEDYVNAHGGIAGRKMKVIIKGIAVLTGTFDSQAQAVCEAFTRDTPVFAVITYPNTGSDVLPACLAQHDSVQIEHGNSIFRTREEIAGTYKSSFYDPHRIELDRMDMVIDNLFDQGYFDKGAKVGLIRLDRPGYEWTEKNVVRPALARHGLTLADSYAFKQPDSTAAISGTANEANAVVLRFRSEGITHVIFQLTLTALPFLVMPAAESQGYHPRYGFTSGDLPDFLSQNVPAAQLRRAAVVGWSRIADLGERQTFDDSEAMKTCMKIVASAGLSNPAQGYGVVCDPFLFLQAALNRSPRVSAAGFRAGVDALGSTFSLLDAPATSFGPNRFSGPSAIRPLTFDEPCACFKYVSGPRPVP